MVEPGDLAQAYAAVRDRIGEAAARVGRRARDVVLVAVTKAATPDQIRALVEMGQVDLAENRVQQLTQRVAQLQEYLSRRRRMGQAVERAPDEMPDRVRWHMVGHLQRNKVKQVVPIVELIHSVDSLRLAEELHNHAHRTERVVDVLVQVNTSGEPGKHGISPPAAPHFIEQLDTMLYLRPRGLMTMAPYSENPEHARPCFARTTELFHDVRTQGLGGREFNILSMGMSNDFEVAIEEGANIVRIGRALFGDGA